MEEKWIVAVSGGVDSMALLDICRQKKMNILVAHVNYHKRSSAKRDEKGVEAYCSRYHIPFFVRHMNSYNRDNFQAQARAYRYAFFSELVKAQKAQGVLVAHHLDDVLETYQMQKERANIPKYYGLKATTTLYGICVKRPLLNYTKEALYAYCKKQKIVFFEDESNQDMIYERNRIRYKLQPLSNIQKQTMLEEIKMKNQELQRLYTVSISFLQHCQDNMKIEELLAFSNTQASFILYQFIRQQTTKTDVSKRFLTEVLQLCKCKKNFQKAIGEYTFYRSYTHLEIMESKNVGFSFMYTRLQFEKTAYFEICEQGKTIEGLYVRDGDFPLTIRSAKPADKICLRMGSKKVSRFFIDCKIPRAQRLSWPVVVNTMGKVIFVCGIGCDIEHYSTKFNMFMLK
ncbi:MAG: tRNA lysidine(34) synthetase TilS [Breznakia sp.]